MKKVLLVFTLLASLGAVPLQATLFWADTMAYTPAGGNITNISGGIWFTHSGGADTFIQNYPGSAAALAGNRYEVNQNNTGDIHRWLVPATTNQFNSGSLYASFIVAATNLPANAGGSYFTHFMDTNTFFRGRVFNLLPSNPYPYTNAGPGTFRLGVANAQGDASNGTNGPNVIVPIDLALNTDYQIVLKVNIDFETATIWVNPASESDTANSSGAATDNGPYASTNFLAAFSFRQALGEGILEIRNVMVGDSFADVVTNTPAIPVIGQPPLGVTNYSGNAAILEVAASGMGVLTYQWYHNGSLMGGATSQSYVINSLGVGDVGSYSCAVTNSAGGLVSSSAYVSVNTTLTAPTITTRPQNATNFIGDTVVLTGIGAGSGPLTYQWQHLGGLGYTNVVDGASPYTADGCVTSGSQSPYLTLTGVSTNETGWYQVIVTGAQSPAKTSNPAYLLVLTGHPASIAYLHSLEDPSTWQATNTTTKFLVTGVITVYTNFVGYYNNEASYYIQDDTGGISLLNYYTAGTGNYPIGSVDWRPQMGDIVTAVGTLSMYNNNIEFHVSGDYDAGYEYANVIDHTNVLPAPFVMSPYLTNNPAFMETNVEGRLIMLTNVYLPATNISSITGNKTLTVTSGGMPYYLNLPAGSDVDLRGHIIPANAFAWTITGPCVQFYSGSTYSKAGYEISVSRWADIVTAPPRSRLTSRRPSPATTWS